MKTKVKNNDTTLTIESANGVITISSSANNNCAVVDRICSDATEVSQFNQWVDFCKTNPPYVRDIITREDVVL